MGVAIAVTTVVVAAAGRANRVLRRAIGGQQRCYHGVIEACALQRKPRMDRTSKISLLFPIKHLSASEGKLRPMNLSLALGTIVIKRSP